jgi:hypothetical protein
MSSLVNSQFAVDHHLAGKSTNLFFRQSFDFPRSRPAVGRLAMTGAQKTGQIVEYPYDVTMVCIKNRHHGNIIFN